MDNRYPYKDFDEDYAPMIEDVKEKIVKIRRRMSRIDVEMFELKNTLNNLRSPLIVTSPYKIKKEYRNNDT